jgi:hypothetical protein
MDQPEQYAISDEIVEIPLILNRREKAADYVAYDRGLQAYAHVIGLPDEPGFIIFECRPCEIKARAGVD